MRSTYRTGFKQQHQLYSTWVDMIRRCYNPKREAYKRYGARGITVCERWFNSFENFCADMGERPKGTTLDRINNNGNYCPENCKWSTREEQMANKRSRCAHVYIEYNGESRPIGEWSRILGVSVTALWKRWYKNGTLDKSL